MRRIAVRTGLLSIPSLRRVADRGRSPQVAPRARPLFDRHVGSSPDPPYGAPEWCATDVAGAPSHCAFCERMLFVLPKLRARLYSVHRPLDVNPQDFEQLLTGCEVHGNHSFVASIVATFAAMMKQPLYPEVNAHILAWSGASERLSKCVRRASKLLPPADALTMIRRSVLELPDTTTNADMCNNVLHALQGQPDVRLLPGNKKLDLGVVASIAGALVRQGDKEAAMELAEAAVHYRLREGPAVRDAEVVAAECAEAAATLGNSELVARFSFVMFRGCGALSVPTKPSGIFSDWWKTRVGRLDSQAQASVADTFEESLTQVLASSIRATLINTDAEKGILDATALCNKLQSAASWDAQCAMTTVILAHMVKQHSGVAGDKTNLLQTTAVHLLASLADGSPAAASEKQVAGMADCVVMTMSLFASASHVALSCGRILTVHRALSPLRVVEFFSRLPAPGECRRRALPLMLSGCAGLGRWDLAQAALSECRTGAGSFADLLHQLVDEANASLRDADLTVAALSLHCELFNPLGKLPGSLVLSDELLLLFAHSLAIAVTKPPANVAMNALLQLAVAYQSADCYRLMPHSCATELLTAASVHQHPSAATVCERHALSRVLLRTSLGLCAGSEEWRHLGPLSNVSFSLSEGFGVEGSGQCFAAVIIVDASAVRSCEGLPQFLAAAEMVMTEAVRRSDAGLSASALLVFSWNSLVEATECFGAAAFSEGWTARKNFCAALPLLCPASSLETASVEALASGLVLLLQSPTTTKAVDETVVDKLRSRISLWVEAEGHEGEAPSSASGRFHTLSRRKLSASKTLHNVRNLLAQRGPSAVTNAPPPTKSVSPSAATLRAGEHMAVKGGVNLSRLSCPRL
jgi:hypothetical protein